MIYILILIIGIVAIFNIFILYAMWTNKKPDEYKWISIEPDPDCKICNGTGVIDDLPCPCSEELV